MGSKQSICLYEQDPPGTFTAKAAKKDGNIALGDAQRSNTLECVGKLALYKSPCCTCRSQQPPSQPRQCQRVRLGQWATGSGRGGLSA